MQKKEIVNKIHTLGLARWLSSEKGLPHTNLMTRVQFPESTTRRRNELSNSPQTGNGTYTPYHTVTNNYFQILGKYQEKYLLKIMNTIIVDICYMCVLNDKKT